MARCRVAWHAIMRPIGVPGWVSVRTSRASFFFLLPMREVRNVVNAARTRKEAMSTRATLSARYSALCYSLLIISIPSSWCFCFLSRQASEANVPTCTGIRTRVHTRAHVRSWEGERRSVGWSKDGSSQPWFPLLFDIAYGSGSNKIKNRIIGSGGCGTVTYEKKKDTKKERPKKKTVNGYSSGLESSPWLWE